MIGSHRGAGATPGHEAPRLLGAVLAGGRSRRFGRDKTAALAGGRPMIRRAVDALAASCADVVVVSSRNETPRGAWRILPDLRPGVGPLAGIESALAEAARLGLDGVFVLAADLPLVGPDTVHRVAGGLGEAEAAAPRREGNPGFEPLCAVYRVTCLPAARSLLDEGRREARSLFEAAGGVTVPPDESTGLNVNTPDDLARAEARLTDSEARLADAGARLTDSEARPGEDDGRLGEEEGAS